MFNVWLIIATILIFLFAISCIYALIVWIRRKRYTRERFAFACLMAVVTLTTALFAVAFGQSMPWHLAAGALSWATGQNFTLPAPSFGDYGFLITVYILSLLAIGRLYDRWDGLKSQRQYELEQRHESVPLIREGIGELSRLIQRRQALVIHETNTHQLASQLQNPSYTVAWRDRARELVRLKWTFYTFPADIGWHDNAGCWVGQNVNTKDLALLWCLHQAPSDEDLRSFVEYSKRMQNDNGKARAELIVAVQNDNVMPIREWNGLQIQFETETTLLDQLVDWTDYYHDLRKRFGVDRLPDSESTLSDVYVPPKFCTTGMEATEEAHDLESYLKSWLDEPGQRQLAILGDYGQGKSTAALAFAHWLVNRTEETRIPILIELRGTSPRNQTPLQLLGAWGARYNISAKALLHLHMTGRLLLIFEGFDEMALVGDAEMRLKHFKTLWEFCYPQAKIVITGRPNFFFDEDEMVASLGIREPQADKPYCQTLRLKPFDVAQIRSALRSHDQPLREEVSTFAESSGQFRELISRPSLLHVVSVLWHREKLSKQLDKLTSAYVMKLFVQHSYRRQGLKETATPGFMALVTEERHYFMKGVATYMASKSLPNQIGGVQLNEAIEALVVAMPEHVSMQATAIAGEVRRPLQDRIDESEHGLEHVQTDVRTCGLLVDDPAAPGTFRFGHKSFMEYLVSEVIAERIMNPETPEARSLLAATGAGPAVVLRLPASVDFLGEQIGGNRTVGELAEAEQKEVVSRLLYALAGPRIAPWSPRFELISLANAAVSIRAGGWQTVSAGLFGAITMWLSATPGISVVAGVAVIMVAWVGHLPPILTVLAVVTCVMVGAVVRYVQSATWSSTGQGKTAEEQAEYVHWTEAWNTLSVDVGVNPRLLFQMTGTSWLPWTRGRRFDLFLESKQTHDRE